MTTETLEGLRLAKGWSAERLGEELGRVMGRSAYTHSRILQIEKFGVDSIKMMEALTKIYNVPFSEMREIARVVPHL